MCHHLNFGFLPEDRGYSGGGLVIEPLPDIWERIAAVRSSGRTDGTWLYPPIEETKGHGAEPLKIPAKVYAVPETHRLSPSGKSYMPEDDFCDLIISIIGFFKGLRLIPEGWNHFYKTPICLPGELVDFYLEDKQMERVLDQVVSWYSGVSPNVRSRMFGALHWYLTSQSYDHDFEIFSAQYIVLDSCWNIFRCMIGKEPKDLHAKRPAIMCDHFGMPVPCWAEISEKRSYLSNLRNEFLHEGVFAKGAIGFKYPQRHPDIDLELKELNSRLIMALLGFKASYIQSPVDHRSGIRYFLNLE